MDADRFNNLKIKIQHEVERLQGLELECAEKGDYSSALQYKFQRMGVLHTWYLVCSSEYGSALG